MTATRLDPITALVVIDLQKGILAYPSVHPVSAILVQASALAAAFRGYGLPIALVNVTGTAPGRTELQRPSAALPPGFADFAPELGQRPSDHTETKKTWGAFTGTGLEAYLKTKDATQIVLCGVATSIGVESTARHAYELGFNLTLAIDAMTDTNPEAHANSISRIFPRLGETATTPEIIALLEKNKGLT